MNYIIYLAAILSVSWIYMLYNLNEEYSLVSRLLNAQQDEETEDTSTITPTNNNIGIAFVILLHNLKTIRTALVTMQLLQSPRNCFVIHADRKIPEGDLKYLKTQITERNLTNVQIIATQNGTWGSMELVYASMDGINRAFLDFPNWHYMALLSGDSVPIKPLEEIQDRLVNMWPKNSLTSSSGKDGIIESRNEVFRSKQLRFPLEPGETFSQKVVGLENVYYGSQWVTLTRPFVKWALFESFPRNFLIYLTKTHVNYNPDTGMPSTFDESFFQTLIMNSPFKDHVDGQCIRFEKWESCNYAHEDRIFPCMLGEDDIKEFNSTSCLFARKFVFGHLPSIITNRMHPKYD